MIESQNLKNQMREVNTDELAHLTAPRADWRDMGQSDHFVQFYEADGFLLNSLSGFIGTALTAGDSAIVVATPTHRDGLDELLNANGIDISNARALGRYVSLDAAETLSKFMIDGAPQPDRFREVMGNVITNVTDGSGRVRAFGEMVALLWLEGNHSGAIRLEELWNELQNSHAFSLFCAYPMNGFGGEKFAEPLSGVCTVHSRVIPAESYAGIPDPDARLRALQSYSKRPDRSKLRLAYANRPKNACGFL